MFIGHYVLGQKLPLRIATVNGAGAPVEPDDTPVAAVIDGDGSAVARYQVPARDPHIMSGWFERRVDLHSAYSTGRHTIIYTYFVDDLPFGRIEEFEVIAGGDGAGTGVGLYYYSQPQADFLLLQTDTGQLKTRRNPRVQ
jgi:hypothetical protein